MAGSMPAKVIGRADAASPTPRGSSAVGGARLRSDAVADLGEHLRDHRAAAGGDQQARAVGPEGDAAVDVAISDRISQRLLARVIGDGKGPGCLLIQRLGNLAAGRLRSGGAYWHIVWLRSGGGQRERDRDDRQRDSKHDDDPDGADCGRRLVYGCGVVVVFGNRFRGHGEPFSSDVELRFAEHNAHDPVFQHLLKYDLSSRRSDHGALRSKQVAQLLSSAVKPGNHRSDRAVHEHRDLPAPQAFHVCVIDHHPELLRQSLHRRLDCVVRQRL
jgi:hypothetical protein